MGIQVKIAVILLAVIFSVIISLIVFDEISDPLIVDDNGTLTIRTPVNDGENRLVAEKLVDVIIEKYDSGQTLDLLDGEPLGFRLTNGEVRYVFILDDELAAIAHYIPGAIGATFESINAVRTFDQVSRDLESEGQTWIHYEKYNPNTNKIESKTSLLKLHDGIVFGSGFYN